MRRARRRGLAWAAGYAAFLLAVAAGANVALYRHYRRATWTPQPRKPMPSVRHVPPRTIMRLGWIEDRRDSSFTRFEAAKRPGIVRVGCLGDSFTYGAEVGPSEDYPSILRRLFRERGYRQVEVINFGSGWYGFQQAFTLWEDVARGFDLDYVLLGPKTFFPRRDATFDHSSPSTIHFHHARRVLDGDGLRLEEVVGDTYESRTAAYRRLVPYWRYLRYDRRAPAFLACWAPGREMANPFYYRRNPAAEISEVYRRMLARLADGGAQIVVGHYDDWVVELARSVRRSNLHAVKFEEVQRFPYRAPADHGSPAGNRLLAEQYFSMLTGRHAADTPLIALRPVEVPAVGPAGRPRPLKDFARVEPRLEGAGGAPWRLVEVVDGTKRRELAPDFARGTGIRGLLAVRADGQLLAESSFYPSPIDLRDGLPLTARSPRGSRELGRVRLLSPDAQVAVVDVSSSLAASRPLFKTADAALTASSGLAPLLPARVFLGERPLFTLRRTEGNSVLLHPLLRRFVVLYPPAEVLAVRPGPNVLALRIGPRISVPLASWRRAERGLPAAFDGALPRPIKRAEASRRPRRRSGGSAPSREQAAPPPS